MKISLKNARYKRSEIERCKSMKEASFILPELQDYSGLKGPDLMKYLTILLGSDDTYIWLVKRGQKTIGCQMMYITGDIARVACVRVNYHDLPRLIEEATKMAQVRGVREVQLQSFPSRKVEKLGFKLHRMIYKIETPKVEVKEDAISVVSGGNDSGDGTLSPRNA